jgi:hypothetical protein
MREFPLVGSSLGGEVLVGGFLLVLEFSGAGVVEHACWMGAPHNWGCLSGACWVGVFFTIN